MTEKFIPTAGISQSYPKGRLLKRVFLALALCLVALSVTACKNSDEMHKLNIPVKNQAITWGMDKEACEKALKGIDQNTKLKETEKREYARIYEFPAPLETEFGISATTKFSISEPGGLSYVWFLYPDTTPEKLLEKLTNKYGEMEETNAFAPEDEQDNPYLGKYYAPEGASAKALNSDTYQKLKKLIAAQDRSMMDGVSMTDEDREEAAEEILDKANLLILRVAAYENEETAEKGTYLELQGNYLAMLAAK